MITRDGIGNSSDKTTVYVYTAVFFNLIFLKIFDIINYKVRKEITMDMWFDSDICWCADSIRCENTECFRHLSNKNDEERIFTCGSLMGTEYCPMHKESEE